MCCSYKHFPYLDIAKIGFTGFVVITRFFRQQMSTFYLFGGRGEVQSGRKPPFPQNSWIFLSLKRPLTLPPPLRFGGGGLPWVFLNEYSVFLKKKKKRKSAKRKNEGKYYILAKKRKKKRKSSVYSSTLYSWKLLFSFCAITPSPS